MITGFKAETFISLFFIILHEGSHYIAARFYGYKGYGIEITPIGAALVLKDINDAEPFEDIIITLSGPMLNILLTVIFYVLSCFYNINILHSCFKINLALGIFNLLPALPLDGGRILRAVFSIKKIYRDADRKAVNYSVIISSIMMFFDIGLFIDQHFSFPLALLSFFIFYYSIKEKERIVYIIMGDVVRKKYKFMSKGYIENRNISVYYKKELANVMSIMDKNRYNVFYVMDENMKVIRIIYEEQLIDALKTYGNITLEEYTHLYKED